jgi:Thioredoxin-like
MTWKRVNAGVILNCVYVLNPVRYSGDLDPDNLFVKSCFDDNSRLRLTSSADTAIQFSGYQVFQNRAIARSIKISQRGNLVADIKVTLLEPWSAAEGDSLLTPPKDAVFQPYQRELWDPKLVPVYQVGAVIPFSPDNHRYRGYANIPVVIQKDGTVKVLVSNTMPGTLLVKDVIEDAMRKWKYQPYVIDGQVIEVATNLRYQIDGTPFVPEYEQKKTPVVTAPEDFTSAYDPKRDPIADLELAKAQARQSKKNIFLEVGGDWCIWCTRMDGFLKKRQEVHGLLEADYVVMKVNMSDSNENKTFLGQLPEIDGYPHIFIFDSEGKLLISKSTDDLMTGVDTYNPKLFSGLLERWKVQ